MKVNVSSTITDIYEPKKLPENGKFCDIFNRLKTEVAEQRQAQNADTDMGRHKDAIRKTRTGR